MLAALPGPIPGAIGIQEHHVFQTGLRKTLLSAPIWVIRGMMAEMGRQVAVVLYVVAMAAVIVGIDLVFFRNQFWERLSVNIGIVLVFGAFYFKFLARP